MHTSTLGHPPRPRAHLHVHLVDFRIHQYGFWWKCKGLFLIFDRFLSWATPSWGCGFSECSKKVSQTYPSFFNLARALADCCKLGNSPAFHQILQFSDFVESSLWVLYLMIDFLALCCQLTDVSLLLVVFTHSSNKKWPIVVFTYGSSMLIRN